MATDGFTPLYVQMARDLRSAILAGKYEMGSPIPSEQELLKAYSTTRGTVRNALSILVNEGLVRQVHGKGTFVQLRKAAYRIRNFGGFTDTLNSSTQVALAKVISAEVREVDGEQVFVLVRLRGVESGSKVELLSLDTSILPTRLFPGIQDHDFENGSLYEILRRVYGVNPARTEVALRPHVPDAATAELLEEPGDRPLLRAQGEAFDADGRAIEQIDVVYASTVEFDLVTTIHEVPQASRP